jgi:hypothetical protein
MEAPEKIYLTKNLLGELRDGWDALPSEVFTNIEYTRTDTFIEKACNAYCKVCGHYAHSVPTHICRHDCRYFSDFKKYTKGE